MLAPDDPESAAVIQGAARRIATTTGHEPVTTPPASAAPGTSTEPPASDRPSRAGFVTELRRETTGLLNVTLGEERLRDLRAEGEAMSTDDAVAYALNAITHAQLHHDA